MTWIARSGWSWGACFSGETYVPNITWVPTSATRIFLPIILPTFSEFF